MDTSQVLAEFHGDKDFPVQWKNEQEKKLFRAAAAAAGGKITGTSGRGQVHTKPLHDGFGWAGYTTKSLDRTGQLLGVDKVTFISRELKQLTRKAWEAPLPPKRKWTRQTAATTKLRIPSALLSTTSLSAGTLDASAGPH